MQKKYNSIGEMAGKIYRALEKNGPMEDAALKKEVEITDTNLFNQAIGWLAREDKINFEKKGKTSTLSLAAAPV